MKPYVDSMNQPVSTKSAATNIHYQISVFISTLLPSINYLVIQNFELYVWYLLLVRVKIHLFKVVSLQPRSEGGDVKDLTETCTRLNAQVGIVGHISFKNT